MLLKGDGVPDVFSMRMHPHSGMQRFFMKRGALGSGSRSNNLELTQSCRNASFQAVSFAVENHSSKFVSGINEIARQQLTAPLAESCMDFKAEAAITQLLGPQPFASRCR